MIPTSLRELMFAVFSLSIFLALAAYVAGPDYAVLGTWSLIFGIMSGVVLSATHANERDKPLGYWEAQRKVMEMSGQDLPAMPEINSTSILYLALTMEELGEQARTMERVLPRTWETAEPRAALYAAGNTLAEMSTKLRTLAAQSKQLRHPVSLKDAQALLDDAMDVSVVTAAFPLACGLPTVDAYNEVQRSNLSKANPDTGVIDKDPSGKWIKGVNYTPPNLMRVLEDRVFTSARIHYED